MFIHPRLTLSTFVLIALNLAAAHHSLNANFDTSRTVSITGTITELNYTYPHVEFDLEVNDDTPQVWLIDGPNPGLAGRYGLSEEALAVGTPVTVVGYPARDGSRTARPLQIILGGQTINLPR